MRPNQISSPGRPRDELVLVVNPRASRLRPGEPEAVRARLEPAFAVRVVATEARGHATALCRKAASAGAPLVAVLGGDGTMSEAAGGLAGTSTALAPLPAGVTDVFARSLGIPRDPAAAASALARTAATGALRTRAVDLGTVGGRPFLFTAGVGLSAALAEAGDARQERKAALGQLHFAREALGLVVRRYLRDPPPLRVEAEGRVAEGMTAIAQNAAVLTYFGPRPVRACAGAGLATGTLSVAVLGRVGPLGAASVVLRLLSGRARAVAGHARITTLEPVHGATITGRGLPVEADGEFLGRHDRIELGIAPGALQVAGAA